MDLDFQLLSDGSDMLLREEHLPDGALESAIAGIQVWLGSWEYDQSQGIPYQSDERGTELLRVAYLRELLATPGVAAVPTLTLTVDSATRTCDIVFQITLDSGQTTSGQITRSY
jgi:hypothetical protein